MNLPRRTILKMLPLSAFPTSHATDAQGPYLGQGTLCGEVTQSTALLQTRLTSATELDADGDLPGASGVACFEWSAKADLSDARRTPFQTASEATDFILRAEITSLTPNTTYYYRPVFGNSEASAKPGPECSFKTLPSGETDTPVTFIVGSCMNYNKFMLGKKGKASGPETATEEDKRLGFPSFDSMLQLRPDFFIGTGDIVYYDHPLRVAKTVPQLRKCWHEQFRFPRMIGFFGQVPTYWSKDDHDFRYNEGDNTSDELPLPETGIDLFREQLPIAAADQPTYRTHRVGKNLQIWLTEGRDYRSPNEMPDGPEKSLWGTEQREWLKTTLKASDAKWKIIISPTPMVGPDDRKKIDNHADISGFRYEADAFFAWLKENRIDNLRLICGDRHWQYHSIHPSGIEEFACGALNDENSRMGVAPGARNGSDPEALIKQPYTSVTPQGGFLQITADAAQLALEHFDSRGNSLNRVTR